MSVSLTVHGSHKNSAGCCTDTIPQPFYGDLYITDCPFLWCGSLVIHGSLHVPAGCTCTITGDLTIYMSGQAPDGGFIDIQGELIIQGATSYINGDGNGN